MLTKSPRVSICARDLYPIRHSSYVDECCRILSEASEYPTDVYLVQLTSLHCFVEKVNRVLSPEELGVGAGATPIGACVKLLESEFLQLRTSLSANSDIPQKGKFALPFPVVLSPSKSNTHRPDLLFVYSNIIEAFPYEIALNDRINPSRYSMHHFSRLNMLYACLKSAKSCFDAFLLLPASVWFELPYILWSMLSHSIMILSKLSLFTGEGWDQQYVRSVLDFSSNVDRIAHKLDEAKALMKLSAADSSSIFRGDVPEFFSTLSLKLQHIKTAHETRLAAQLNASRDPPLNSNASAISEDELAMPPGTELFEFLDDSFWVQFT